MPTTRLYSTDPDESWTDHLAHCPNTGIGYASNVKYKVTGQPTQEHQNEDFGFGFKPDEERDLCLYGVFDGHELGHGQKVAAFAAQKITAEILFAEALKEPAPTEEEIKRTMCLAFGAVEKGYFDSIGEILARRAELQIQIQGMNSFEATNQFPEVVTQLETYNQQVLGGTTAVVALECEGKLYVANCGDARALLCRVDVHGQLHVWQVSTQHDATNEHERKRLTALGLSQQSIQHIGTPYCTRCLGDFRRKGGYKEIETLSEATAEPVIAEPDYWGGHVLDGGCRFLILMSAGVYNAWEDATGSKRANADIAGMVAAEFSSQNSLDAVAQAVIDRIKRVHHDAFLRYDDRSHLCEHMDDMTLLVRNFNQPLPFAGQDTHTFVQAEEAAHLRDIELEMDTSLPMGASALNTGGVTMRDGQTVSEASSWCFQEDRVSLHLDSDGKVPSYIDFTEYYENEQRMKNENCDVDV